MMMYSRSDNRNTALAVLGQALAHLAVVVVFTLCSAAALAQPEVPHDLSPMGMFQQADWVVKFVMLGLVLASVLTWAVWGVKTVELRRARQSNESLVAQLARAESLQSCLAASEQEKGTLKGPVDALLAAAREELEQSKKLPSAGIKERLEGRFARIQSAVTRKAKSGTGLLATVGSTGPFIGLFGTVWGIMNSFIGISQSQTTNLAVVAPGIAEALLATALGLIAAIPAVVMYNIFTRKIGDYRAQVADMAGEVMRLVSLQLDRDGRE